MKLILKMHESLIMKMKRPFFHGIALLGLEVPDLMKDHFLGQFPDAHLIIPIPSRPGNPSW